MGGVPQSGCGTPPEASLDQCLCGLARRYAPQQEIRNPKRIQMNFGSAIFWQLWWVCPAGALGAIVQEAGEGGGEIRQLVAFGALGAEADVVRHNPARAKLAGEPIEFGRRSADCGGPRAIGQGAQRLQHLLGSHACGGIHPQCLEAVPPSQANVYAGFVRILAVPNAVPRASQAVPRRQDKAEG